MAGLDKRRYDAGPQPITAETHPHLADFLPFLDALNGESARGSVLVAISFIEALLHRIIKGFLIEGKSRDQVLEGFNAPVGTFSAKIALATALGLITEQERRECDLLRKIRNKFAHEIHPSFDDPVIKGLCSELAYRAMPYGDVTVDARDSFKTAAIAIILNLTNRPFYVSEAPLMTRDWPQSSLPITAPRP